MTSQKDKAQAFRALHEGDPFVIPNPWDAGSARVFEALGFEALATTSSGFAFTLGRLDGNVTLDEVADHAGVLDRATGLPVSILVLLERVLAHLGDGADEQHEAAVRGWDPHGAPRPEVPFWPARVLLQDFTGIPALADLAALREAVQRLGGKPELVRPGSHGRLGGGDHDRQALAGELVQVGPETGNELGVGVGEGLVEQQHGRLGHERGAERGPRGQAGRKVAHRLLAALAPVRSGAWRRSWVAKRSRPC